MVFAQEELERDVIICELVTEGDQVFPGVLPLFNDRAVTVRAKAGGGFNGLFMASWYLPMAPGDGE